jgi:hypothetical protein
MNFEPFGDPVFFTLGQTETTTFVRQNIVLDREFAKISQFHGRG